MRTTIELDDRLVAEAIEESGKKTKREAIEEALREYVRMQRRHKLADSIRSGDFDISLTLDELDQLRGRSG